jgi:hypothetical protein
VARRILNLVTGLSLLLCAALTVLWVRSYWRHDQFGWRRVWASEREPSPYPSRPWRGKGDWTTLRYATAESNMGALDIDVGVQEFDFATSEVSDSGFYWLADEWPYRLTASEEWPWRLQHAWKDEPDSRHHSVNLMVPSWAAALAAAAAPVAWTFGLLRRRRLRRRGFAPTLGDDPPGKPGGASPECELLKT